MLKHLYIKDFTLIDELDIPFGSGFSVITGETGAGKSIILGALHLLLGQRADSRLIKVGCKKCVIEAHFDLSHYDMEEFFDRNEIDFEPEDCIVRREVSSNGKSRAFINDTPVSLNQMRALGDQLIDIHSQHQNLLLQKEDFQLNVVDIIAGNSVLFEEYKGAYHAWIDRRNRFNDFQEECKRSKENEDFLRFQFTELDKAKIVAGEETELERQAQTLSHTEEIKSALYGASCDLSSEETGGVSQTKEASCKLLDIIDVYPDIREVAERLDSAYIELKDIAREIDNRMDNVDYDPQQLEAINARLDLLYSLEQKFHASTTAELVSEHDRIAAMLQNIDNSDERLQELCQEADEAYEHCRALAVRLSEVRKGAAKKVENEMKARLVPLGIPKVQFAIDFQECDCSISGIDKVQFLFSANSSTIMQPIAQVASGGEIARVMLSLKAMISGAVKLPTIIFDEIDTGVSGRVAEKMAHIMREMGDNHRQVISITHLPQIAAMGAAHYKVSKEETAQGTVSRMVLLSTEERVAEIAQMLSGSDVTDAAMANARALINSNLQ